MGKDRGEANKADILVRVCYRQPNKDKEADEAFYKQLVEISQLLALVLLRDFNLPDICWKYNTVERKQPRRFLECGSWFLEISLLVPGDIISCFLEITS